MFRNIPFETANLPPYIALIVATTLMLLYSTVFRQQSYKPVFGSYRQCWGFTTRGELCFWNRQVTDGFYYYENIFPNYYGNLSFCSMLFCVQLSRVDILFSFTKVEGFCVVFFSRVCIFISVHVLLCKRMYFLRHSVPTWLHPPS